MKKTINNSKGIVGLLLCLLLLSLAGNAQVAGTHFAVGLANVTSTSTTIEMDLQLTVDGSVNSRLLGFSAGINYNTAIVNGGTLTFEYIGGRSQALSTFNPNTLNSANTPGHLRIAASSLSSASGIDVTIGQVLTLGRYRLTNSVAWPSASNAQLWLQNTASGRTATAISATGFGVTSGGVYAYSTTTPSGSPGVSLNQTSTSTLTLMLNAQVCATSASQTASSGVTCFGGSNGSSTITMSPTPTVASITYTVDGGSSQSATLVNGSFTVSNLTAGAHEIIISNTGCSNVTASSVSVGGPSQLTNSITETACDTFTWAVNEQTYTTSGTYTGTTTNGSGCTVNETLNLTINQSSVYYADTDGDGYGDSSVTTNACSQPSGYVSNSTDCNDTNSSVNPAATEVANGIDDDCDGTIDEGTTPSAPGVSNSTVCVGSASVTLTATAFPGHTLRWYAAATGGTALTATPVVVTTAAIVKSFWVSQRLGTGPESTRAQITVTVVALPAIPGTITGTAAICNVVGSSTELTYSIAAVTGATSYVWTVPTGANIVSGQGSTSVTVNFAGVAQGITALTLGVQSVNASACLSVAKTLSLTRVLPVAPASVVLTNPAGATPATAITAVGPFIGTSTPLTLTAAVTASANSYSWTLPAGVNVISGNPATDRVLVIDFANAAPGVTSITASVVSVSGCGNSIAKALVLTKVLPAKPAAITTTQTNVCLIAGSESTVTYTVVPVVGAFANGYTWTVPTGASIVGSATGNSIVVSYSSSFNAAGSVTVTSSNGVGTSATAATLAVAATAPLVPATLVMTLAPSTTAVVVAGPFMATSTELTLTAAPVAGAVSYAWTLPAGVNQVSGGTGRIITVNFADVVTPTGITALTISVKAVNGCGLQSPAKVLSLTRALPVKPVAITTTLANVCAIAGTNATVTYSVAPVAGAFADGYAWTVPTGATIVSGQGTTSIAVSYAGNFTAGNVSVTSSNGVGTSAATTLAVARTSGAVAPAALVGQVAGLCAGTAYNYSFVAGANAQTYTITGPVGSVVTSADNASNTSNVITTSNLAFTVVYPTTAIVNISIVASNPCGSAAAKLFVVSKAMGAIATISGPTAVDTCSEYTYTASAVVGAVAYTWTVPSGAQIVSGQGTNTLVVTFPGTLATGAVLKVLATNGCSVSSALKSSSVLTRTTCPTAREEVVLQEVTKTPFSVKAYPNPYTETFNLSLSTSSEDKVSVVVYDMTGRLIERRDVRPSDMMEQQIGDRQPSGVYNVVVTQGEEVKTVRVIKR